MIDSLLHEINQLHQKKALLTIEEVAEFLNCSEKVIYNWTKRADPNKRPPRLIVGKSIRFPKTEFVKWLAHEQNASGDN